MSRSSDYVESPCTKFLQWDSEKSEFNFWDKEAKEKVSVELPLRFIVLDELATIKGYSESQKSGIWSNEVKNTSKEPLIVRTSKGVIAEGLYKEITGDIAKEGGKYTKSIYVAIENEDKELEIQNFQFKGAAFSGWLDFVKDNKRAIYAKAVVCHSFKSEKKGKVTYTVPEFKIDDTTSEENAQAKALDRTLQKYLVSYFSKSKAETVDADEQHETSDY